MSCSSDSVLERPVLIRAAAAISGVMILIVFGGLIYSVAFIRSSHYGAFLFFCIIYGFLSCLLFALGRLIRLKAFIWVPVLIAVWIGPFVLGHYWGYQDEKYAVWRMVRDDTENTFNSQWRELSREELFDRYVHSVTGKNHKGFRAYLDLMAHEGWRGFERTCAVSYKIDRTGIWVWIAWFMQLVFMMAAVSVAMGATIPDDMLSRDKEKSTGKKNFLSRAVKKPLPPKPEHERKASERTDIVRISARQEQGGWWAIDAEFKGRKESFTAYFPDTSPSAKTFFEDIWHAIYRLETQGPLAALTVLRSVEGGMTAKEALDKFNADIEKVRQLLGPYFRSFEEHDRFFSSFFSGE